MIVQRIVLVDGGQIVRGFSHSGQVVDDIIEHRPQGDGDCWNWLVKYAADVNFSARSVRYFRDNVVRVEYRDG